MTQCVTCGVQLHPERARKYPYCTAPGCQEKNAKGLTMVAIGMNKAADELLILDERTRENLASGQYHDQRRGSFGTSAAGSPAGGSAAAGAPAAAAPSAAGSPAGGSAAGSPAAGSASVAGPRSAGPRGQETGLPRRAARRAGRRCAPAPERRAWTDRQERLALLYNEQGLRPAEIAGKLGVSPYLATQIVLAARKRRSR